MTMIWNLRRSGLNIRQRNNFELIAGIVLILAGIIRMPNGDEMRAMTRLTTETMMIFGMAGFLFFRVNKWLALFIAIVTVASFFPKFDRFAHWRREAILFGLAWYAFIFLYIDNQDFIFNAVCVVALANCIALAMQFNGLDPYRISSLFTGRGSSSDFTGLMFNRNELSALFGISFSLFFRNGWRKFLPVIGAGLISSKSTCGAAAAFVSTMIWFIYQRQIIPAILTTAAAAVYIFVFDERNYESLMFRWKYLKLAGRILGDYPVLGIGPGHWHLASNQMHAHNDMAQIGVEMGFAGILAMIGYVVNLVKRIDVNAFMILSAIIAVTLISFAWFIPTTALIMISLLAVIDNDGQQKKQAG